MANHLTDEEQENFELRLKELGMDLSQVVAELVTGATSGPTILSEVPEHTSAIPAHILTFDSVDEIKRLCGNSDEQFERGLMQAHHALLPEWPKEKDNHLPQDLEAQENHNLRQALIAFVYGHSDRVKSYKTIIEKHYFPMMVGAFAIQDVTVSAGHPLILTGNNQTYNFGTVTIEPGGQIINQGVNVAIVAQKMVVLANDAALVTATDSPHTFDSSGQDGKNADQVPPDQGGYPDQGAPGAAGVDNNDDCNCRQQAGQGGTGQTGNTGQSGVNGGNGTSGGQIKLTITNMTGNYSFKSSGGQGGNGGKGGKGGKGQTGGPGGSASTYCGGGTQGTGGPGGKGGQGGGAGKGGDAGDIYVTYTAGDPAPTFSFTAQAATKGLYGVGGDGGPGGDGNPPGPTGLVGDPGADATDGKPGQMFVNGKPASATA